MATDPKPQPGPKPDRITIGKPPATPAEPATPPAARDRFGEKAGAIRVDADPPTPPAARIPDASELEKLLRDRFGQKAGAIRIDADPAGGPAFLVYVDAEGKELSREQYKPAGTTAPDGDV